MLLSIPWSFPNLMDLWTWNNLDVTYNRSSRFSMNCSDIIKETITETLTKHAQLQKKHMSKITSGFISLCTLINNNRRLWSTLSAEEHEHTLWPFRRRYSSVSPTSRGWQARRRLAATAPSCRFRQTRKGASCESKFMALPVSIDQSDYQQTWPTVIQVNSQVWVLTV